MKKVIFLFLLLNNAILWGGAFDYSYPCDTCEPKPTKNYSYLLDLVEKRISNKQSLDDPLPYEVFSDTPLIKACSEGDDYLVITNLILSKGGDPNVANIRGETPLLCAVRKYSIATVRLLLEKKAEIDKATTFGVTALSRICLSDQDTKDISLVQKRIDIVTCLLNAKADPKRGLNFHELIGRHFIGQTSVHAFICPNERELFLKQRESLIRLLIDHGGNLLKTNKDGKTAIDLAYHNNYLPGLRQDCIELAEFAKYYDFFVLITSFRTSNVYTSFLNYLPSDLAKEIVKYVHPIHKKKLPSEKLCEPYAKTIHPFCT